MRLGFGIDGSYDNDCKGLEGGRPDRRERKQREDSPHETNANPAVRPRWALDGLIGIQNQATD
jgi:hypothetical protein